MKTQVKKIDQHKRELTVEVEDAEAVTAVEEERVVAPEGELSIEEEAEADATVEEDKAVAPESELPGTEDSDRGEVEEDA